MALAVALAMWVGTTGTTVHAAVPDKFVYDQSANAILFEIETHGGVASALQELTTTPEFVLYGDGTVVWTRYNDKRDLRQLWTAQLNKDEVQQELHFIVEAGWNDWLDRYDSSVVNLPTTTFTLNLKDAPARRQIYGMELGFKSGKLPEGMSRVYQHFAHYKHAGEDLYEPDHVLVFARKMSKLEAKRGAKTLKWNVKQVKLADFARESETEYGQTTVSGKDVDRVMNRLRDWTLYSTDLSVVFFKEKKDAYQVGYRPLLPGEQ
jgi:hypothetical protein